MIHDSAKEDVASDAPRFEPGVVVDGKYVITQLLGVGASSAVYEATHEAIGHRIAIKVVHRELAMRQDIIERFRREARLCGGIRDRHVGQVYDVGQLPDGAPYMVMELQEGEPLEDLLKRKTLPIAAVIDAGRQLLAGLSAAHAVNVVHRDVKPSNLMLTSERNGEQLLKLVDFGISKHVTRDITERNVTAAGTVVGSPDYMPPEQLSGADIDHRADIYAAGVVLYEAVTGRMPFDAPSITELLAAILRDPLTPPSTLRTDCPPALSHVILRAMSRDRDDRFESAAEMSHALSQIVIEHQLPEGAQAWNVDQLPTSVEIERVRTAERQPKKRPWQRYALGSAAVGLMLLPVLASGDNVEPRVSAVVEVAPMQPAATAPTTAPTTATTSPILPLNPVEPAPEVVDSKQAQPDERAKAVVKPRRASKPPSVDVVALVGEASGAFVHGQLAKAMTLYQKAAAASPTHAVAWRGLGMTAMKMNRRQDARAAFEKYLELQPSAPDVARIREKLADL